MIEQPEDNQQGPVSPGRAYVPNPVAVTLPRGEPSSTDDLDPSSYPRERAHA